jgi:type IV secretory pathway TraG/TraD family ATPase VirD4
MQTVYSPDRPVSRFQQLLGMKDSEPPVTDQEYALYVRFRDSVAFAPPQVITSLPPCPPEADRKSRALVRRLLTDPRFATALGLMEQARASELARRGQQDELERRAKAIAERKALDERLAAVDAFHTNQLNEVRFGLREFQHLIGEQSLAEASLRITQESYSDFKKNQRALNLNLAQQGGGQSALIFGTLAGFENSLRDRSNARRMEVELAKVTIRRSLVSMQDHERATLRMADVLVALNVITPDERLLVVVPIVWNEGQCDIDFDQTSSEFRVRAAMLETLRPLLAAGLRTSAGARERLNQAVRDALGPDSNLHQREVIERYLYSGNRWMTEAEAARDLSRGEPSPSALRIGGFPGSDAELTYDQRESLVTIAPPGSGKTQAHVLRNLLYLNAPAFVLDVKGEMLAQTRAWRQNNVGPTYLFRPTTPNDSVHYNPIDGIRTDPDWAWDDARRLADFLVVPSGRQSDDYFESRARDMVTTALLDVALFEKPPHRSMSGVLDWIYTSDEVEIKEWCQDLEASGNPQLILQGRALKGMPEKQRESVFDTARRSLEIWQSPAIRKISADTTFDQAGLRGEKATLYLAVTLEDIKKYASVLRVLIGQSLAKIYRETPESDAPTITFFLDELARLGRMDVIEESLDVGRGYGVRLWIFCQNFGQLKLSYPNAQGMISNCAVRCYMNPDEDAARWLSENLGTREGLLDGNRKPLVEAHQLTGPEFANQVIVFSRGQLPARLEKKPAFADSFCLKRIEGAAEDVRDQEIGAAQAPLAGSPGAPDDVDIVGPLNWDEVLNTAPAPIPETTARRADTDKRRLALAGLAGGILLGAIVWLGIWASELRSLRAENATLAAARLTADGANQSYAKEKAVWTQTLRATERARDAFLNDAQAAKAELSRERDAHAATRDRLAGAQRDLDAERTRAAVRASQPAPQTMVAPPSPAAPAAIAPQAAASPPAVPAKQGEPVQQQVSTDCDMLAGNPNDPRRVGAGVKYGDLLRNTGPAIEACERALSANPGEQRFLYQKARALYAANDDRARPIFDGLMKAGYPSAFDNVAQYLVREGRTREAEPLFRKGVSLQDPDAMVSLANAIRAGTIAPRTLGEDAILYQMAAKAGHQAAKAYVEQQQAVGNFISQTGGQILRGIGR